MSSHYTRYVEEIVRLKVSANFVCGEEGERKQMKQSKEKNRKMHHHLASIVRTSNIERLEKLSKFDYDLQIKEKPNQTEYNDDAECRCRCAHYIIL